MIFLKRIQGMMQGPTKWAQKFAWYFDLSAMSSWHLPFTEIEMLQESLLQELSKMYNGYEGGNVAVHHSAKLSLVRRLMEDTLVQGERLVLVSYFTQVCCHSNISHLPNLLGMSKPKLLSLISDPGPTSIIMWWDGSSIFTFGWFNSCNPAYNHCWWV